MSRRREISKRQDALADIAGIMSAMKGLALMETRILADILTSQRKMVTAIEHTAAEFYSCYPMLLCSTTQARELCIVIGAEQGFCGDFNETLLVQMQQRQESHQGPIDWIVLGRRLMQRLPVKEAHLLALSGAIVADEVQMVLLNLTQKISQLLLQEHHTGCALTVLYHSDATGEIRLRHLLPLRDLPLNTRSYRYPPELLITPEAFLLGLTDHYLYAILNEVLYSSLMAENRQRLTHMERALQRLDEEKDKLRLVYNIRRQEEITEEIETILLSVDMMAD